MTIEIFRKWDEVETDIREKIIEFASDSLEPIDLKNFRFECKIALPIKQAVKIYLSLKTLPNGDIEVRGVLLPKEANRNETDKIFVYTRCIIGKHHKLKKKPHTRGISWT